MSTISTVVLIYDFSNGCSITRVNLALLSQACSDKAMLSHYKFCYATLNVMRVPVGAQRFSYHFAGISSGTSRVLEGTQKWDVQNRRLLPGKDVIRSTIRTMLFDFNSIVYL